MNKITLLYSLLLSVFCFVGALNCAESQYEISKKKWDQARLELIETPEDKDRWKEHKICCNMEQILYTLRDDCKKSKQGRPASFLEDSEECIAFARQKEMLRLCRENVQFLDKRAENTPLYRNFINARREMDEAYESQFYQDGTK